jgi:uncharacterized membrane protein YdbT with pleckstrin-like domain
MGTNQEKVIYERGLHPGVFVMPSVLLLFVIVMGGFVRFISGLMVTPFRQLQGSYPAPNIEWFQLIAALPCLIFVVAVFVVTWLAYRNNLVKLTTERLTIKTGFLSKTEATLGNTEIESVFLRQPLLGRWLRYGTVVVVGTGGTPFEMPFMPDPKDLHEKVLYVRTLVKLPPRPIARPEPPIQDDSRYMPKGR